jgi:hypothetical protein
LQLSAFGQNATGSISGTVVDSTGAVVPKAKVVLQSESTNALRESISNGSGIFSFAAVYPGSYSVTVSNTGFTSWEEKGIVLTQGGNIALPNIILQVGATKTEVQVVASGDVVVPTDTGQASQTLNQGMVEELSIVGRDAAELMKIMPGMAMNTGLGQGMWNSYTTSSNTGPIGAFSAMGTQPNGGMTMTSDGANLLDPGNQGTQTANINQNQVAEVSILTSAYGAEFAKGPITFQAIGKSGGAQFHGSGYLYARNGIFNADDSYNKAQGVLAPNDAFYYPGGDFGGPVILPGLKFNKHHDKLFFYTAYENMRQKAAGEVQNRFLPDSNMLSGNFSPAELASLGNGFKNAYGTMSGNPCSGNCTVTTGGPGVAGVMPGGIIPASMLDPNSLIYAKTYPATTTNPATSPVGANFQFETNGCCSGLTTNRWEYRARADYNISDNTKLFFSWNTQHENDDTITGVWWQQGGALPYPSPQLATQKSNVYSSNLTHVFGPTLTNEFVFADATLINPIILSNPAAVNPTTLGFKMTGFFTDQYTPQLPTVYSWEGQIPGYFTYPYGQPWPAGGKDSFGKLSQTPNISDNLTWVKGQHTLKTGFYWDFARNNQTGGSPSAADMGSALIETYGANSSGNSMADFLTGRIAGFTQADGDVVSDYKYYQYSFYASDQWKVSRRLTLTLGARIEHMGQWAPASGPGSAVWDPYVYASDVAAGTGYPGLRWHGEDSSIPMSGFPSQPFFVEPRVGFAYDIFGNGKTVLRGGAGIYRYQLAYNSASNGQSEPLNLPTLSTTWSCCIGWNSFNQYNPGSGGVAGAGTSPGTIAMGDSKTPYTETYNFTISQRAPWNSVFELQYSGNTSHDLLLNGSMNQAYLIPYGAFFKPDPRTGAPGLVQGTANTGVNLTTNDYYAYNFYNGGVNMEGHGSYQNYNGLIASWQKQTGRSTFTVNYTFGKVLGVRDNETDNGGGNGSAVYPYNIGQNYGVLAYDHSQIFNAAYVINLPKPIHNNALLAGVVNGWQLSGITQMQSGAPIQPLTGGNMNVLWPSSYSAQNFLGTNQGQALVEPAITCDPRNGGGSYFNTACFAPPTVGTNGSFIWPYIKGPAFFNSDLALYKNFAFKEHQKVQFRMSAFNFLNHPLPQLGISGNSDIQLNFTNPNGTLSQTNTNTNTSGNALYTVGRRVVEFSVKYNF